MKVGHGEVGDVGVVFAGALVWANVDPHDSGLCACESTVDFFNPNRRGYLGINREHFKQQLLHTRVISMRLTRKGRAGARLPPEELV